jgi:hypothetical protein
MLFVSRLHKESIVCLEPAVTEAEDATLLEAATKQRREDRD